MTLRPALLLVAAAVVFGAVFLLRSGGVADAPAVSRIEMAQGRDQLVLEVRRDTGAWVLASAHDAPGDAERIAAFVEAVRDLEEGAPAERPAGEPLEVRLTAEDGTVIRHLALWPGIAEARPIGRPFVSTLPVPDLGPSAWSRLAPPAIDPAGLVAARRITPAGATALDPAARAALAAELASLSADGWVPARSLDWSAAEYLQVTRADGEILEVQRLARPDGRRFVRLTAERDPAFRAVRFFAFPVAAPAR